MDDATTLLPVLADAAATLENEDDLHAAAAFFLAGLRDHCGVRRAVLTLCDVQGKDRQWFFSGLTNADIDWFHAHRLDEGQRQRLLADRPRRGRVVAVPPGACPNRAGLRAAAAPAAGVTGEGVFLFLPLPAHAGGVLGVLLIEDDAPDARPAAWSAGLELWCAPLARLLERKRLDHTARNTDMRLHQIQEQLMQADKLSAIGQLISGVAHELNNPLSGVLGFTQLVLASETNPKAKRHLERIYGEALRCQKIVQNLLGFARRSRPERTPQRLNDVVEGVLDLRAYQLQVDDVAIERRYATDLPPSLFDTHQVQQVVLNLLNNAHQAMMTVADRERRLIVTTARHGDRLSVSVADTGPGIPKDRLPRLFEPFYTTKEEGKGTGLGLSVSLGIVREHGGDIQVESTVGRGTTFTFEMPIVACGEAPGKETGMASSAAPPPPTAQAGLRILVVDDEPVLRELLADLLKSAGHIVEVARDGRVGLGLALERPYDLILSDLKMPGLDGQGLYEGVVRERPEMRDRFLFSTGDVINPDALGFLAGTGCAYLSKPFKLEAVLALVDRLAHRRAA
jgi:signal transduction histidine kinase